MNTKTMMWQGGIFRKRILCLAVAAICASPMGAMAQEATFGLEAETPPPDPDVVRDLTEVRSEVNVGVGYVNHDSFKFGEYTGLEEEGAYAVLDVDIQKRGAYDGDSAEYWNLIGTNLGLSSRYLRYERGNQGQYSVFLEYDQIPAFRSDTSKTIYDGAGGTNLTLPAGWVAGTTTAGMTNLTSSLKSFDVETERQRVGVGLELALSKQWQFKTRYRHETKEGIKTIGAVIGNSGGNPRAVLLPEPVDYETDLLDITFGYTDAKSQFQVGYHMSLFKDNKQSLTWQNPYALIGGWDASVEYAAGGQGRLGLPPDNEFHQISASGGYNFSDKTRVTADLAIGRMTQNDAFLPYTVNPTLAASITQPLPRSSLDGQIDTTLLNLKLSSRPTTDLYWNAAYRYDDRDNKTPRNEYVYIGGDSQTQDTGATSSRRRYNEPYSFTENNLQANVGYHVARRTDLTAGIEHSKIERTYSEREEVKENTLKLGVKSGITDTLSGGIRLSRADRDGSTYIGEEPFLSSYASGYTATVAGGWENHPDLRKFHLADRTRDKLTLFANLLASQQVSIGFNASLLQDDYTNSSMGLKESDINNYTLDVSYIPSEDISLYAFYTYEELESIQSGRSFRGFAKLAESADPTRDWTANHQDQVDSIGLGVKWAITPHVFDVGADYVYSKTEALVDVTTGSAFPAATETAAETEVQSLGIYGSYKLKTDMRLRVNYWVEKYDTTDWAYIAANQLANVITLGDQSPNYTVHVITASVSYRF